MTHMLLRFVEDVKWRVAEFGLHTFLYPVIYVDAVGRRGRQVLVIELLHFLLELEQEGRREGGREDSLIPICTCV